MPVTDKSLPIKPGDSVVKDQRVGQLVQPGKFALRIDVPAHDINRVAINQPVKVRGQGLGMQLTGRSQIESYQNKGGK